MTPQRSAGRGRHPDPAHRSSPSCRCTSWSVSSIKPLQDVQGAFTWLPGHVTIQPFIDMWRTVPLGRYFVNSLIVSGVARRCSR